MSNKKTHLLAQSIWNLPKQRPDNLPNSEPTSWVVGNFYLGLFFQCFVATIEGDPNDIFVAVVDQVRALTPRGRSGFFPTPEVNAVYASLDVLARHPHSGDLWFVPDWPKGSMSFPHQTSEMRYHSLSSPQTEPLADSQA